MSTAATTAEAAPARRRGGFWRAPAGPALLSSALVTLTVLLANAAFLLRTRSNNPILYHSGLGDPEYGTIGLPVGKEHGSYTVDPNDGWTAQALGRLAAESWRDGQIPLWNVFEGLGQPHAGEMQSAAFFLPFVLLQLFSNGIFLMHLALELVAGLSMLAFLRTYGLSWVAATAGASLFAVNGVYSVMTNAPFNPIAFLPMCLWGVELVARAVQERRRPRLGLAVIAAGLAWSLYAGFPETALIQGLLIAGWVIVRALGLAPHRVRFLMWNAAGAALGLMLAAPILVSLVHFLGFGFTAYHGDGHEAPAAYPAHRFFGFFMPYVTGAMGINPLGQTGYVVLGVLFLALVGLLGRHTLLIRLFLLGVVVIHMLNMYGVEIVNKALNLIPGMELVLLYKYGIILIVFACITLAAFAVDDLRRGRLRLSAVLVAALLTGAYVAAVLVYVDGQDLFVEGWSGMVIAVSIGGAVLLLAALLLGRWRAALPAALLAGLVAVLQGGAFYAANQVNASPQRPVDMAPIDFLQRNLGTSRFYATGPIQPNYGSYWGIAQLNANDLPVPQKYADYVMDKLRPAPGSPAGNAPKRAFIPYILVGGLMYDLPQQQLIFAAYGQQQQYFRDAGVRYVVTAPGVADDATAAKFGLRKVFMSEKTEIFEDRGSHPYYTTPGGACSVSRPTRTALTLDCPTATTLVRRELNAPGWTATVNGKPQAVPTSPDQYFQRIEVPQGRSTIEFTYRPSFFVPSVALGALGLLLVIGQWVLPARLRRRGEDDEMAAPDDGATVPVTPAR
ncbi:hypothetical protein ACQP1U_04320 [Actinomycetota bacterium]